MNKYDDPCTNAQCDNKLGRHGAKGLCGRCYQAAQRARFKLDPWQFCEVCKRPSAGPGNKWCEMHYARARRLGDPGIAEGLIRARGTGGMSSKGYMVLQRHGRRIPEHCWIVEESIGRELHPFENVHHKNGVRDDNRIENLEIWIVPQPKGQRPADLLAWCTENMVAITEAAAWNAA